MRIVVQDFENRQFLAPDGNWVVTKEEARIFPDSVQAISFCIKRQMRAVRLVVMSEADKEETYFYPFGGDPFVKAERKKLRKSLAASHRLKQQQRIIKSRLDGVMAEMKERKKAFPFKRNLDKEKKPRPQ